MSLITEAQLEEIVRTWFADLGYAVCNDSAINPDSGQPERQAYTDVILEGRLEAALGRINPTIPYEAILDAKRKFLQTERPSLVEENRRLHTYFVEGVDVEYYAQDGTLTGDTVWPLDFENPENNDWLVVNQFTVVENKAKRRPDVVVFVNGLPLAVIELKNPGDENATVDHAYNQLQTYKQQVGTLFRTNAALVVSDGLVARVGSLTADKERFMPWRTVAGDGVSPKGTPELETLVKGVFEKRRFLTLIRDFTVFGDTGNRLVKIIAGYHQFHAVQHAVAATLRASEPRGDRKIGVIWHTQGSGKSLLMAFYAGQIVKHPQLENPTLVVITDRNDLDDQLFNTFSLCKGLIRQTPQQAKDRDDLRAILSRQAGGVIFTTIQKFTPEGGEAEYPLLTDRRNVIVMADEAHRTQYGFRAKVKHTTGELSYGFAKYLRDALPNASFIGFTGTPVEQGDRSTRSIFGDDIDVYDITRAVEDGATVPIYYESRLIKIEVDDEQRQAMDDFGETLEEENEKSATFRLLEKVVGADDRLEKLAADLVGHYEDRIAGLDGKAMIVCMSRRIAVALYDNIIRLRPDWHSDQDEAGRVKIVMTGSAADPPEWQPHACNKARKDLLAKRARDPQDELKLVIVCDMWLTGFDAPCMHTMYVDKPLKGHNLMQAIARVNRVFKDKPAGLVVDYIGIAQSLKHALGQYSQPDQEKVGIDEAEAVAVLMQQYEIVRDIFHGFDYLPALHGSDMERLSKMAEAIEWILDLLQREAEAVSVEGKSDKQVEQEKKRVHRRYNDAVLALSKAFALAAATEQARAIREEVGFFQAIRAALAKSRASDGRSALDRELAIQQIVSRSVVSTDIIDILQATGVETHDISILSDEFLAEVQALNKKNLAMEALRKLLNGEIRSQSKRNIVQSRLFSERLEQAISQYHMNALTSVQVLEELVNLAKDIRAARERGEEQGLSDDEVAFYDALAENASAREAMGDDQLKVIAHELLAQVKGNLSIDWMHRESARARLRILVKRILKKYGYPPDLQDAAVQTVLQQAEALSAEWVRAL